MPSFTQLKAAAANLLLQKNGKLTNRLKRESVPEFNLGQVPADRKPTATATTVCGFCSTGCGLEVHLKDGRGVNLTPAKTYPVNSGMACPKGWEAMAVLDSPNRATTPLLRSESGKMAPISWDRALETFCQRFRAIADEHGPESVAFISTGQMVTEEMALLGALAKFGMGMVHGDGNTRQCMATAVVAYKQSFGFDAPPYSYQDFEESDVIVLVGSNLAIAHPIMWGRVAKNPHRPEIIVIDPRYTETAMASTQHYPIQPKSDLAFFYSIAHILLRFDWIDHDFIRDHVSGFDEFAAHIQDYTPEKGAESSGIAVEDLHRLAATIARGKRVSFWWTMGVNQSHEGVRVAQSIINLALITGNIGRPGTGANSITGQCNAMGSRLFSNTTNLLGAHDFTKPSDRAKVAEILDIPVDRIPTVNSWSYDKIVEGISSGKIKGLWVLATNSAHSWINQNEFRRIIEDLDFLVVQDMYANTHTAQLADLILPAAGWGEKEGTFINSERRIGRVKRVSPPPGEARSDFDTFRSIAAAWGCEELLSRWTTPEAVFGIMKELSAGQPCDITGIRDYAMLDQHGGVQWPFHAGSTIAAEPLANQRRLFADGRFFHTDGKAKLIVGSPTPLLETTDDDYPLVLLTGRGSAAQWHTQTRTGESAILRQLYPSDPYAEINHKDAHRLGLEANQWVAVESRRGRIKVRAMLSYGVQPGQIFIPMHDVQTNQLTFPSFDPHSRQPSYKHAAVRVRPWPSYES